MGGHDVCSGATKAIGFSCKVALVSQALITLYTCCPKEIKSLIFTTSTSTESPHGGARTDGTRISKEDLSIVALKKKWLLFSVLYIFDDLMHTTVSISKAEWEGYECEFMWRIATEDTAKPFSITFIGTSLSVYAYSYPSCFLAFSLKKNGLYFVTCVGGPIQS